MANEIQTRYYCIDWRRSIKCICVAVCAIPEKNFVPQFVTFTAVSQHAMTQLKISPVVIKAQPNLYQKKQLNKVDMTY